MKKILWVVVLVLIISLSAVFTACNSATPQGLLGDYWGNFEHFTYAVTDKTDADNIIKGTYTYSIEKFAKDSDVTLAEGFTLKKVSKGNLIVGSLDINGEKIDTACFFKISSDNAFLVPVASYRKSVNADMTEIIKMTYEGTTCNYEIDTNGTIKKGSIGNKSPMYDTNEIYNTLRGASTLGTTFSMSFSVPLPTEDTSASLTAQCSSTQTLQSPVESANALYGEGIECYKVTLSRSTEVGGVSYQLYYGTQEMAVSNWKIIRPLIKIVEGSVEYDLTAVSVVKA